MFGVFLPSINFRGNRSPYLWWFYKFQNAFGHQAGYICGSEYFSDPAFLLLKGRAEAGEELAKYLQYKIPDQATLDQQIRADIALDVWQKIENRFPANPLEAFRYFCLDADDFLYSALTNSIDQLETRGSLEAIITCVNCATLQKICRNRNLPLIHLELGPLRSPAYLGTAYFDFSGVNGGTEAHKRFNSAIDMPFVAADHSEVDALRDLFFVTKVLDQTAPKVELGIGLQVEDDSNIICYSSGVSALSLINSAAYLLTEKKIKEPVLVRSHPGSMFTLQNLPRGFIADKSSSAIQFILQCERIHAVNSSLVVEALLLNRQVESYGDSPFAFCIDQNRHAVDPAAFVFFLLNYLVPWEQVFSIDYIRWRLSRPDEETIRRTHLEIYMNEKIRILESQVAELEFALAEKTRALSVIDRELTQIKSSIFWRLSYPLRLLYRFYKQVAKKT